jgi:hypothetical protein
MLSLILWRLSNAYTPRRAPRSCVMGKIGGTAGAALGVEAECRGLDVAVRTNGDAFDTAFYSFEFGVAWP